MFAVLYAELMALQRELRFIAMRSLKVNPILLLDGLLPGNVSAAVGQAYKAAQVTVHLGILAMRNTEKLDEVFWNPIFALLRDQYAMATISTACCVIVTLVLLLGTLDVDMDEVQQSFDGLVSGAADKHRRSEAKKERRSLYETFADTFGVSSKNAKPPTREPLRVPSEASWKAASQVKVKSPRSRWLTQGAASFFSKLSLSRSARPSESSVQSFSRDDSDAPFSISSGLQYVVGSPERAGSDHGSIVAVSPARTPFFRSFSALGGTGSRGRAQSNRSTSRSDDISVGDTDGDESYTDSPVAAPKQRRSISMNEASLMDPMDPRDVLGWQVEVPGYGRGIVKDVRKSLFFGKSVYEIDFGTGRVTPVSLKRGQKGLPFKLVKKVD